MRFVKLALIVLLAGCAAGTSLQFARYAERTEIRKNFELKSALTQAIDSLEISIDYMPQGALDKYFLVLNPSSISGSQVSIIQKRPNAEAELEKIRSQDRWRAIEKVAKERQVPMSLISQLELWAKATGPVSFPHGAADRKPKIGGSAMFRSGQTVDETRLNPYALYDISGVVRLDVFRVDITNYSSVAITLNTRDIYLINDLGNQGNPIEMDFFETLYLKAPVEKQKPARYANVQRSLLVNSPIFPGQSRKAFLAFYALPEDATGATIRWIVDNQNGTSKSWDFVQTRETIQEKYICVPVRIPTQSSDNDPRHPTSFNWEHIIVFSDPPGVGVSSTDADGWAVLYINTRDIGNDISIYAIGAGNPAGTYCKVYFGKKEIVFDSVRHESISSHYEILTVEEYKIEI